MMCELLHEAAELVRPEPDRHRALAERGAGAAFGRSVAVLRECGITVILDAENLPDDSDPGRVSFPWEQLRAELARIRASLPG